VATLTDVAMALFAFLAIGSLVLLIPQPREELVCLKAIDDALACMERNCSIALERPLSFYSDRVCCGEMCFYGNTSLRGTYSLLICEEGECRGE